MYRDYKSKNVQFYFVYKSLAHPELVDGLIQPLTQEERLQHVKLAEKKLGTTIPWLADTIDNQFKHALGNRPNSEFIIAPNGEIVVKRAWSDPSRTRKDLERLVGKSLTLTQPDETGIKILFPKSTSKKPTSSKGIARKGMRPLKVKPIQTEGIYYAKLRAEAADAMIRSGSGKVYIGFHLDPIHQAHWNNLAEPLSYSINVPNGVSIQKPKGVAAPRKSANDSEPREFLLDVSNWKKGQALVVSVSYVACIGSTCIPVTQKYEVVLIRDSDGGNARGEKAGFWESDDFASRLMSGDENGDGKLSKNEVMGLVVPHFRAFDLNNDGLLEKGEITKIVDWLNDPLKAPPLNSNR